MLVGTLVAGPLSNTIGRKWTYILGVRGSLGIGYALIAAAQNRWMLHLGRFLHGNFLFIFYIDRYFIYYVDIFL